MVLLAHFPPELVTKILAHLDPISIVQSQQVCRFFNSIITDDPAFQYKIQLAICGMEDGPPGPLGSMDRLARLKSHQRAWDSARWSSDFEITMHDGVWELYGGVLAQATNQRALTFTQLPSEIREIPKKSWVVQDLPFVIRDFTIDPSQDLLVIFEITERPHSLYRLHLRSLETGTAHPAASDPAYLSHIPGGEDDSFTCRISGDFVGALFKYPGDIENELLIWNWKTGSLELAVSRVTSSSFCFLTERHILVAVLSGIGSRLVSKLLVIDFIMATSEMQDLSSIDFQCALYLPSFDPSSILFAFSICSDPAPGWAPQPSLQVPFHVAHQDRVFVLTLSVAHSAGWRTFLIFLPSSTVSRCLYASLEKHKREHLWEEWGPDGTRFIEAPSAHSLVRECFIYGTSYISAATARTAEECHRVRIFDFHPLAPRKQRSDREGEDTGVDGATQIHDTPHTVDPKGDIFSEPVRTTLPYRVRTLKIPSMAKGPISAVMISEDSVAVVHDLMLSFLSKRLYVREYHVLTF